MRSRLAIVGLVAVIVARCAATHVDHAPSTSLHSAADQEASRIALPSFVEPFYVYFDFGKMSLTSEAQQVVAEAVAAAKAVQVGCVLITAHTDTVGTHARNQHLSERRAEAIRAEVLRLGFDGRAIDTVGRSFDDPMVQTGPNVREPQNRRAVVEFGRDDPSACRRS